MSLSDRPWAGVSSLIAYVGDRVAMTGAGSLLEGAFVEDGVSVQVTVRARARRSRRWSSQGLACWSRKKVTSS